MIHFNPTLFLRIDDILDYYSQLPLQVGRALRAYVSSLGWFDEKPQRIRLISLRRMEILS